MSRSKERTTAPSDASPASDEKAPERRGSGGFDARDALAGRLDDATVAEVAGERR